VAAHAVLELAHEGLWRSSSAKSSAGSARRMAATSIRLLASTRGRLRALARLQRQRVDDAGQLLAPGGQQRGQVGVELALAAVEGRHHVELGARVQAGLLQRLVPVGHAAGGVAHEVEHRHDGRAQAARMSISARYLGSTGWRVSITSMAQSACSSRARSTLASCSKAARASGPRRKARTRSVRVSPGWRARKSSSATESSSPGVSMKRAASRRPAAAPAPGRGAWCRGARTPRRNPPAA
jgi:hypothetical protein